MFEYTPDRFIEECFLCVDLSFLGSLKGSPGFGIPGQPGPKGESGERVSAIKK